MKGLKRFFTLLAVSAAFALFTGNLTVMADNPPGGTDGDFINGSVQTEPEGTGTSPGTSTENSQTDGNGNTSPNPSVTEMFVCDKNGIITGINPEYLQSLGTQELKISLTIPSSVNGTKVTGIGPNAFMPAQYPQYVINFVSLDFSKAAITSIGNNAFLGCTGLTGTLRLPSTLTSVGENAFSYTGFSYVYFPAGNCSYGAGAFGNMKNLAAAICHDEASYHNLSSLSIVNPDKLTYPLTLYFQDESGRETANSRSALYNMPLTYVMKDNRSWANDKDYKLPSPSFEGDYTWKWSTELNSSNSVTPSSLVKGNLLVAVKSITKPAISFGGDINKTYDKSEAVLTVTASHPKAKAYKDAVNGDVVFFYTWEWTDNTGIHNKESEYDKNSLEFTNSSDFTCNVKVQAFIKGDDKAFYEESHDYHVKIRQISSVVKPVVSSGTVSVDGQLPDLSLGEGSTPGDIVWDENQTIQEGKKEYSWTFTPKDKINYSTAAGKVTLQGTAAPLYTINVSTSGRGKVSPDGTVTVEKGKDILFTFTPDPGYKLGTATLDNIDVTGKVKDNSYKIENAPAGDSQEHKLSVSFKQLDSDDMKQMFSSLPVITSDKMTPDQGNAYLDAIIQYRSLSANRTTSVSQDTLLAFYRTLAKHPKIEFDIDNKGPVSISDYTALLDSMTLEDAKGLRDGTVSHLSISIDVKDTNLNTQQRDMIKAAKKDAVITDSYNISLKKSVTKPEGTNDTYLTDPRYPLTLKFPVPKGIKAPASGYERTFYVAAVHEQSNSRSSTDILSNKDSSGKTITVATDRFSVFTVLYQDIKKAEDPHTSSGQNNSSDNKNNDNNSSSNTYVPDYEKDFWDNVSNLIKKAKAGDTVNVNAVTYDKMPESVMAALRENPQVALIVRWDGGKPVIIPAQTALAFEKGRVYYPLSLLSELYAKVNASLTAPVPTPPSSGTSGGGSSWDISAPSSNNTTYTPTSKDKGTEIEAETESESDTETQETETPSESMEESSEVPESVPHKDLDTQEIRKTSESKTIAVVLIASCVLLILVVVIIVVLLSIKKKQD